MAHPQTPLEDASTQTTDRNSFILVDTRDASTQAGAEEFISQENTRDSSTQTLDDSLSHLQLSPVTSETSEESRKRKISNVQEITHCTNVDKLPRTKTCRMGNQFVLTHGSDVDKLTRTETCGMGDELDFSLNVLKVYSGNTRNISTQENVASNKNISQKEKAPREKSDTDISKDMNVSSVDDILAVPGPSGCLENKSQSKSCVERLQNGSSVKQQPAEETERRQSTCLSCKKTISGHVEVHDGKDMYRCCLCQSMHESVNCLQMHVFVEHAWLKDNEECKITDTITSKSANACSVDDRLVISGTPPSLENNSPSKLYVENVQNVSPLKLQPPVETEQIQPRCLSCNETVSEHVEVLFEKVWYKCCRCSVRKENFSYLQIHVYDEHARPYYCHVCQMKYSDVDSHARDQTCDVCYQNFECKYQLEEHYFSYHEKSLKTHCRICKKGFDDHSTFSEGVKRYQCCFSECEFQNKQKSKFICHLYKHFHLKIYKCEECGNHFKQTSKLKTHLQNIHPLCELCEKRFLNVHFLYKHYCEEHKDE